MIKKLSVQLGVGILFFVLFTACQEDLPSNGGIKSSDLLCLYNLIELQADQAIDLNFDGDANVDLTKEIETFRDCWVGFGRKSHDLSIAWLEPSTDRNIFLLYPIPTVYDESMTIKYQSIGIQYYYRLNSERTQLIPEGIALDQATNYYTFVCPKLLDIDKKNNLISFQTEQAFLTKDGLVTRTLTAKFEPKSPEYAFR